MVTHFYKLARRSQRDRLNSFSKLSADLSTLRHKGLNAELLSSGGVFFVGVEGRNFTWACYAWANYVLTSYHQ